MLHDTKTGEKCAKWSLNFPNGRKISQMVAKYVNIFHSKALQNLPKLVFLVGKLVNHLATLNLKPSPLASFTLEPFEPGQRDFTTARFRVVGVLLFFSTEFPNGTSETVKARSFLVAKMFSLSLKRSSFYSAVGKRFT
jgi:hypothetical protein